MDTAEKPRAIRKKKSEIDTREFQIKQSAPFTMPPIHEKVEREPSIIVPETNLTKKDFDELAFNEEPVKIIIHRGTDVKFLGRKTPQITDYIAVNGVAAEVLLQNGWVPLGHLPKGIAFYTKRKYIGVIARAKKDAVSHHYVEKEGEDPENIVEHAVQSSLTFSVLEDRNPRSADWLEALIRENVS